MNKWTWIAIGLFVAIVLVILLGVFLGWFKAGKLNLVEGEGTVNSDESRYVAIAKSVKDSLTGLNWQSHYFESVADQLLALNYNELRTVNNIYLQKFATSDSPSLRAIIMGEYLGSFGNPCTASEKQIINSACWKQEKLIQKLNYINA